MPFDCNLRAGECIFDLGLFQALEHKWLESQRFGEDLGLIGIRDWCQRHWKTFQRFRRIEHLFGERRLQQFHTAEFGVWHGLERQEGSPFDLVLGAFECGMENLEFVDWVREHRLPRSEVYEFFTMLDPNCVRMDHSPIIQRATKQLVLA
jgi:hypothetical protein